MRKKEYNLIGYENKKSVGQRVSLIDLFRVDLANRFNGDSIPRIRISSENSAGGLSPLYGGPPHEVLFWKNVTPGVDNTVYSADCRNKYISVHGIAFWGADTHAVELEFGKTKDHLLSASSVTGLHEYHKVNFGVSNIGKTTSLYSSFLFDTFLFTEDGGNGSAVPRLLFDCAFELYTGYATSVIKVWADSTNGYLKVKSDTLAVTLLIWFKIYNKFIPVAEDNPELSLDVYKDAMNPDLSTYSDIFMKLSDTTDYIKKASSTISITGYSGANPLAFETDQTERHYWVLSTTTLKVTQVINLDSIGNINFTNRVIKIFGVMFPKANGSKLMTLGQNLNANMSTQIISWFNLNDDFFLVCNISKFCGAYYLKPLKLL